MFEIVDIETRNNVQDVKIPEKFKIDDDKVYIKKSGNVIYLIPYHDAWKIMIDATSSFSDDYMKDRKQPDNQIRETFDLR
jgi:antitoxin VapB